MLTRTRGVAVIREIIDHAPGVLLNGCVRYEPCTTERSVVLIASEAWLYLFRKIMIKIESFRLLNIRNEKNLTLHN